MIIPFSTLKAAQAAAVLFEADRTNAMGKMRLLKLLYIADRELLMERRRPLTGDDPVAMKNGPVLTHIYDLTKGKGPDQGLWNEFFETIGYQVHLKYPPGVGELGRREYEKLRAVAARYSDTEDFDLSDMTHLFPEWLRNKPLGGSRNPIPLDHVLEATGRLQEKDLILRLAATGAAAKQLFAS